MEIRFAWSLSRWKNVHRWTEKHEQETWTRIENGLNDFDRQVDSQDHVLAAGRTPSSRAVATSPRECLPTNAHENPPQSRIHRTDRETDDKIEVHCCRVFPHQTRKNNIYSSVDRPMPLGRLASQGA